MVVPLSWCQKHAGQYQSTLDAVRVRLRCRVLMGRQSAPRYQRERAEDQAGQGARCTEPPQRGRVEHSTAWVGCGHNCADCSGQRSERFLMLGDLAWTPEALGPIYFLTDMSFTPDLLHSWAHFLFSRGTVPTCDLGQGSRAPVTCVTLKC